MDVGVHLKINMEWGTVKVEIYNFSQFSEHVSQLLLGVLVKVYGTYVQL